MLKVGPRTAALWLFTALIGMISLPMNARGDIYVANFGANTIGEYTNTGAKVNASLVSGLNSPNGLALSGPDLFVANSGSGTAADRTIGKYTASGTTENATLISGLSFPIEMAISGTNLFVVNTNSNSIGEYATSGQTVNANLITGLNHPIGLAIDPTGSTLFVSNLNSGTIGEYTTSGAAVNAAFITGLYASGSLAVSGSDLNPIAVPRAPIRAILRRYSLLRSTIIPPEKRHLRNGIIVNQSFLMGYRDFRAGHF